MALSPELPKAMQRMESQLAELRAANKAANSIIAQQADEMTRLTAERDALRDDESRLNWLAANPLQAHIGGLPASAKAYSIITELSLRAALDVMRTKEP